MTRYTKLDKRKPEYIKDKVSERDSSSESENASVASSSKNKIEDAPLEKDTEQQELDGVREAPKKELSEPAKLLKRVKLLKLKAKKSKDESRKKELAVQIRELEQRVNVLNGERGAKKKMGNASREIRQEGAIAPGVNPWKAMEAERRKVADARSTIRRDKREQERTANTLCYACRQVGHAAKDCTESVALDTTSKESKAGAIVCCYRCGSTEHSLAKCKRPEPRVGPDLPFATCFICGEKGHLASKCKLNKGRGIYPNGGCCKLCQSVDHLAKDCHLRTNASGVNTISNAAIAMGGQHGNGGADEDDFHSLSRKRRAIEEDEKRTEGPTKKRRDAKKVITF